MGETNQNSDLKNKEKFIKSVEYIIYNEFPERILKINLNGTQTTVRKINEEEKNIDLIRGNEKYSITIRKSYNYVTK